MADQVLYTARVRTTGGRDGGASRSRDGRLNVMHSLPGTGTGTNPEQLLAAAWSACFGEAMILTARQMKVTLPPGYAIDAEIDLNLGDSGYFLGARLNVSVPALDRKVAQALVNAAHETCPYSKALRNSIQTAVTLI